MSGRRATLVFAMPLPYATRVTVRGRAEAPTRLRVGVGGFWGTTWWGELTLDPSRHDAQLPIPPRGLDSGIVELVLERVAPGPAVTLSGIEVDPVYGNP
jgi:hypothetical protein